jgi:hypothetical protein
MKFRGSSRNILKTNLNKLENQEEIKAFLDAYDLPKPD